MALDLVAGIEAMMNKISEINTSGAELESAEIDRGFAQNLWTLDINPTDFTIKGESGDYYLSRGDTIIDTDKVVEALNSDSIISVLESLGVSEDELTQRTLSYQSSYKSVYNQQAGIKLLVNQLDNEKTGHELTEKVGDPKTQEELTTILDNNPKLKSKIEKFKRKVVKEGSVETGMWKKRAIKSAMLLGAAGGIWAIIDNHKKAMNGCWLVNIKTGEKCKITTLTCNGDTTDMCSLNAHLCGSHLLLEENTQPCYGTDRCMKKDKTTGECVETLANACDGHGKKSCSKYCGNISAPVGYKTVCISSDFWGAAKDIISDISLPVSKLWMYILAGGILFIVILIVIRNR